MADTTYYDVIGVDPCSSSAEIKRCYYKAALRVHPDKNLDDPAASQRFQELAEAYQVLSDDKLRERYDRMGKAVALVMFPGKPMEFVVLDQVQSFLQPRCVFELIVRFSSRHRSPC